VKLLKLSPLPVQATVPRVVTSPVGMGGLVAQLTAVALAKDAIPIKPAKIASIFLFIV
jgi:hypothetical protein